MSDSNHYSLAVRGVYINIECREHSFLVDGLQEGTFTCPRCGRHFTLTWSANVEPNDGRIVWANGSEMAVGGGDDSKKLHAVDE